MRNIISLSFILLFLMCSCTSKNVKKVESQRLIDTQWELAYLENTDSMQLVLGIANVPITLCINPDSTFTGFSNCGRVEGGIAVEQNSQDVLFVVDERMRNFCLSTTAWNDFVEEVLMAQTYVIENDTLKLFNGEELLTVKLSKAK